MKINVEKNIAKAFLAFLVGWAIITVIAVLNQHVYHWMVVSEGVQLLTLASSFVIACVGVLCGFMFVAWMVTVLAE